MESSSRGSPPNQLPQNSECKANAMELSRVAAVSARDMETTGHAVPHNTPPNRQAAADIPVGWRLSPLSPVANGGHRYPPLLTLAAVISVS
jgi:hypothetical protein